VECVQASREPSRGVRAVAKVKESIGRNRAPERFLRPEADRLPGSEEKEEEKTRGLAARIS
jgi:hypothetical protein